jgi:hypothetical protein
MKRSAYPAGLGIGRRRWLRSGLVAWLALVAVGLWGPGHSLARGLNPPERRHAFATTVAYVVQFYPLWFTYYQSQGASTNRLVGPEKVTPLYHIVVAINTDTIYASTFLDLTDQPVILIVPPTSNTYSILTLDPYGSIFQTDLTPTPSGGTYALTGPGFAGSLPAGVTRVAMPLDFSELIFRTDKFSSTGEDQTAGAEAFRAALFTQPLCAYLGQACPSEIPPGGLALVLPEAAFSEPFKTAADALIATAPIAFLKELQRAVAAPATPPMTADERALSDEFDRLFGAGDFADAQSASGFSGGARAAHALILDAYLTHLDPNNWIHFTNIGDWGDEVIQRAAITEFIQYGNGIGTAAYYHAFRDVHGLPLDGTPPEGYVLTFPADQIPEAKRFWSITAYTPEAIELVDNPANKYEVASYTPGLQKSPDGSISVYLARELPTGVPEANWLPVPSGPFNVMLRIYGVVPGSSVADNTYVPPGIVAAR